MKYLSIMEVVLIHRDRSRDIENNINISHRIVDDPTLWEIIYDDKNVMTFLKICGFHFRPDKRDHLFTRVLVKLWLVILICMGGIGFIWQTFVIGGEAIKNLYDTVKNDDTTLTDVLIDFGKMLVEFFTHLVQATSLMYSLYHINRQLDRAVELEMTSKLLPICKRDAFTFCAIMVLIVITIDPIIINYRGYDAYLDGVSAKTTSYEIYVMNCLSNMSFNLVATLYLSVVMFFNSLTLKQIQSLQKNLLHGIENNHLSNDEYMVQKEKIFFLQKQSYGPSKVITVVAGINVLMEMFQIWHYHYNFEKYYDQGFTYQEMVLFDLRTLPFLFKGIFFTTSTTSLVPNTYTLYFIEIVFFFYVLWTASAINKLHDQLRATIATKCWEANKSSDIKYLQYSAMYQDALEFPIMFEFGPFKVLK